MHYELTTDSRAITLLLLIGASYIFGWRTSSCSCSWLEALPNLSVSSKESRGALPAPLPGGRRSQSAPLGGVPTMAKASQRKDSPMNYEIMSNWARWRRAWTPKTPATPLLSKDREGSISLIWHNGQCWRRARRDEITGQACDREHGPPREAWVFFLKFNG